MVNPITITTTINAPIEKVWNAWTKPEHITKWAFASDDWIAPQAKNDVKVGGRFLTRMESKDGKDGFDFTGTYTMVEKNCLIEYDMDDGRHVATEFEEASDGVKITQTFDPEDENPIEMQREGWQSILNNFKKYVEEVTNDG